jgi:hypothetical protein
VAPDDEEKTDPQVSRPWWVGACDMLPPPYHEDDSDEPLELILPSQRQYEEPSSSMNETGMSGSASAGTSDKSNSASTSS